LVLTGLSDAAAYPALLSESCGVIRAERRRGWGAILFCLPPATCGYSAQGHRVRPARRGRARKAANSL